MNRILLCAALLAGAGICTQARAANTTPASTSTALATCLSTSANAVDRTALVQAVFTAVVAHPDLASIATVDVARRDAISARAAQVLQRLVAQDCKSQARAALADGGLEGMREALGALGEQALGDFTGHPDVQAGMAGVLRHVDAGALLEALLSR